MIAKIKEQRKLGIWYSEDDVFDYGVAKYIGSSALLVYFALCRHANSDGKAFPSIKLLMKECALSNKIIANSTRVLKQVGMIEVERSKKQYNLYYIKSVKEAIRLNKWEKIASVESTPAFGASVESTPATCRIYTCPSVESTHEGHTIEGHTIEGQTDRQTNPRSKYVNCKNDASQSSVVLNTDNQSEKPQSQSDASITPNRSTDESSVALDISNLKWPIALDQNQIVMKALTKLPDDQARQAILDIVAKKLDNGTLQKPVSFLRKVVDNYLMGDFTPLEQTSREVKGLSNKAADRQVYEPNECPYCDEQNTLTYEVIRTGEVQRTSCKRATRFMQSTVKCA